MATQTILGGSKEDVDQILDGWMVREDKLSDSKTRVYRYKKEVSIIVAFRSGKSVGVGVVNHPDEAVVATITPDRFQELISLIGQPAHPSDIMRDTQGITSFSVGAQDW